LYTVVLDSNVLISAIVFGGKPRVILESIIEGKLKLAFSEALLEEIEAVLQGKKFRFSPQITDLIITELQSISEILHPTSTVSVIKKDPADNKVIECAIAANADFIISGDAHLLELGEYRNIKILSPSDFCDTIIAK